MKTPTPLQIGIAGAGSAGLSAAIAFARLGHHVTVFEKHPGLAPLGAGLLIQPQGIRALGELGVRKEFDAQSVPIDRLLGVSHQGWRVVDIRYEQELARAVSRDKLADVLVQAAVVAGVNICFASEIHSLDTLADKALVTTASGEKAFDLFVIADGAASRLRTAAGLARPATAYPWGALWGQFWVKDWPSTSVLQQRYQGPRKMMGLMPTEISPQGVRLSLFWSMRCDEHPVWQNAPLDRWKAEALFLWPEAQPVLRQIRTHADVSFATYRHSWPHRLANGPFVAVGDAAHALTPQLGLGTTLAVQDAIALSEAVHRHGALAGALVYERARKSPVRAYQTLSRLLTPCFQANGWAWPRDVAFSGGRYLPGVAWVMKRSLAY